LIIKIKRYWRKKERELNEIRKKKERLEIEIRRREDEEREVFFCENYFRLIYRKRD
jgi:hypothetical protein